MFMLHFTFQTEQKCLPFLNIVKSLKYFSAIEAFDTTEIVFSFLSSLTILKLYWIFKFIVLQEKKNA